MTFFSVADALIRTLKGHESIATGIKAVPRVVTKRSASHKSGILECLSPIERLIDASYSTAGKVVHTHNNVVGVSRIDGHASLALRAWLGSRVYVLANGDRRKPVRRERCLLGTWHRNCIKAS